MGRGNIATAAPAGGASTAPAPAVDDPADHAPVGVTSGATGGAVTLGLYTVATFLGALLLFLVEPMVSKMLLPLLGGTAAVWNTAMVFFQAVLLAGYLFAHLTVSRLGLRRQPIVQLVCLLLPILVLPVALPRGWIPPTDESPVGWTLLAMTVMVGAPFFMLATVSPTLQRWFAATDHPHAADPYFLYAAGNLGSLIALLAYPVVFEPLLGLTAQAQLWAALYIAFVALCAACVVQLRRHRAPAPLAAAELTPSSVPTATTATMTTAATPTTAATTTTTTPAASAADATGASASEPAAPPLTNRFRLRIVYLALVPSVLLLGVTRQLATNITSFPLLWVIPLALYLITFIIAFGRNAGRAVTIATRCFVVLTAALALSLAWLGMQWLEFLIPLGVFFSAALLAHGQLALERPPAARLTEFYLWLSVGGVVGGIVASLICPVIFKDVYEWPLGILLTFTILPAGMGLAARGGSRPTGAGARAWRPDRADAPFLIVALALVVVATVVRQPSTYAAYFASTAVALVAIVLATRFVRRPLGFSVVTFATLIAFTYVQTSPVLYSTRTFFGVHRVVEAEGGIHDLYNGTTLHGSEWPHPDGPAAAVSYYHRDGPLGHYFVANESAPPRTVGMIGLGAGSVAVYGRPGDRFTYYEIDPATVEIARNPDLFTFLRDSRADATYVVGDGRLQLDRSGQRYDTLIVDAFSSDAIPVHLLTKEAFALYKDHLQPHGVLAVHITNRYFDFQPVIARVAQEDGLAARVRVDHAPPEPAAGGRRSSTWVFLAAADADLGALATDGRYRPLVATPGDPLWTDDRNNVLEALGAAKDGT